MGGDSFFQRIKPPEQERIDIRSDDGRLFGRTTVDRERIVRFPTVPLVVGNVLSPGPFQVQSLLPRQIGQVPQKRSVDGLPLFQLHLAELYPVRPVFRRPFQDREWIEVERTQRIAVDSDLKSVSWRIPSKLPPLPFRGQTTGAPQERKCPISSSFSG